MRGDLRENREMMHYPGTSVRRLSINDVNRKPWYDESRHPVDSGSSAAERVSAMNAARSVERTQPMFDNRPVNEDVYFDLIEQEKVAWGQPFNFQVLIQVFFCKLCEIPAFFGTLKNLVNFNVSRTVLKR